MRLDASEQHLAVAGKPNAFGTQRELITNLQAVCASVGKRLTRKTTALVLCQRDWVLDIERQANQRGVPILTEAHALAFIEDGFVELEDDVSESSIDELIGEARSLLDGEPSARIWDALVALLDRCAPEHEAALADYLSAALNHWRLPPHTRYTLASAPEDHYEELWADACPTGYLRVAPRRWIAEALQDNTSPKLKTADALVLHPLDLSNPNVETLLKTPHFAHVQHLDPRILVDQPTGRVFKTLATSPMAPNLESLTLPGFEPKHTRALKLESPLSLRRLILAPRHLSSFNPSACEDLARSSWLENLEELVVHSFYLISDTFPDAFTTLGTLQRLTIHTDRWLNAVISALAISPPTKTLRLVGQLGGITPMMARTFLDTHLEHTRTLDISKLTLPVTEDALTALIVEIPGSALGRSFQAVRLGHWYSDTLASVFEYNGITVLDAQEPT